MSDGETTPTSASVAAGWWAVPSFRIVKALLCVVVLLCDMVGGQRRRQREKRYVEKRVPCPSRGSHRPPTATARQHHHHHQVQEGCLGRGDPFPSRCTLGTRGRTRRKEEGHRGTRNTFGSQPGGETRRRSKLGLFGPRVRVRWRNKQGERILWAYRSRWRARGTKVGRGGRAVCQGSDGRVCTCLRAARARLRMDG